MLAVLDSTPAFRRMGWLIENATPFSQSGELVRAAAVGSPRSDSEFTVNSPPVASGKRMPASPLSLTSGLPSSKSVSRLFSLRV